MDVQLDPLDLRVLSDWQRLGSLNVGSPGYGELLRELVDVESNRKAVMEFTGDNAKIVINVIDEVSPRDTIVRASTTPYPPVLPLNTRL